MRGKRLRQPGTRQEWAGVLLVLAAALVAMAWGCGKGQEGEGAPPAETSTAGPAAAYPSALSAASSPTEVAQVLIKALDEEDKGTLLGLVAVKAVAKDIEAIYQKHGKTSKGAPKAAPGLAAAGWGATYAFYQTGQTTVTREEVTGESASVFAGGKAPDGSPKTLKIKMVREDGVWKVRGGLETVLQ